MAVHASHASLPYPIRKARFSLLIPYLDADGDPTAPTTPDTEFSGDNGAAADCAEEVSATSGMDGVALMTLTGAETDYSTVALNAKVASGPKPTLALLFPRNLAIVGSGTLSAGSSGGGTLGTILAYDVCGCFIRTTGGTGGGGTGGANNQVRRIITYTPSTGAFTVSPNWETTPSTDTTYDILLPEGVTLGMLRGIAPTLTSAGMMKADALYVGGVLVDPEADPLENSTIADEINTDRYQAKTVLIDDEGGTTDLYLVTFFKSGEPYTGTVTSPTIQIIKAADGTDLVASTALSAIGSTKFYKKSVTGGGRITSGDGYIAVVTATLDGSPRTWSQPVGRDST